MKWTANRQRMALQLLAIERARRSAAEASLGAARKDEEVAARARKTAEESLSSAEDHWSGQLRAGRFDLNLQQALASSVLFRERELASAVAGERESEAQTERRRSDWLAAEARVRARDEVSKRGRRVLFRRQTEESDQALFDQTTWSWFRQ